MATGRERPNQSTLAAHLSEPGTPPPLCPRWDFHPEFPPTFRPLSSRLSRTPRERNALCHKGSRWSQPETGSSARVPPARTELISLIGSARPRNETSQLPHAWGAVNTSRIFLIALEADPRLLLEFEASNRSERPLTNAHSYEVRPKPRPRTGATRFSVTPRR
jgi:hypothetical protein